MGRVPAAGGGGGTHPVFASMRVRFEHLFTLWETIRAPLDVGMLVQLERRRARLRLHGSWTTKSLSMANLVGIGISS